MCLNLCKMMRKFDKFGSPVEFNIKGSESFKTFIGMLWTIGMAAVMIGAMIYYSLLFFDKSNVSVKTESIQGSLAPEMDLKARGMFFTLLFQNGLEFLRPGDVESMFQVEVMQYVITSSGGTDARKIDSSSQAPKKISMTPCKAANISATVNGKPIKGKTTRAISDFGYCPNITDADSTLLLQGDDDSDTYAYIEISLLPCKKQYYSPIKPANSSTCTLPFVTAPLGPNPMNDTLQGELRKELRDLTVTIATVDTAVESDNYEDPIQYILNQDNKFTLAATQEKRANIYFKTVSVTSDYGALYTDDQTVDAFTAGEVVFDSRDRSVTEYYPFIDATGANITRSAPYFVFRFLSSNSRLEYTRSYPKVLDYIGLVGGVGQAFTAVVLVLYSWYNSLRMEQTIYNSIILGEEKEGSDDEDDDNVDGKSKVGQWEQERTLTFWDAAKFNFFRCCFKKNKKYTYYKDHHEHLARSRDICRIIDAITDAESLASVLLSPAQRKLLHYIQTTSETKREVVDEANNSHSSSLMLSGSATTAQAKLSVAKELTSSTEEHLVRLNKILLLNAPDESQLVQESEAEPLNKSPKKSK